MSDERPGSPKWAARKRLEYIDFRLFWDGQFARAELAETFEISAQQASADIAEYARKAPGNLVYDPAAKAHVRGPAYEPISAAESADRHLLQLVAIEAGWMDRAETWFSKPQSMDVVAIPRPPTDPKVLLAILDAIRNRQEVAADYRSMTGTPPAWRSIAPHALHYNAGRWYARAWSREHNDFRDFSLNRIRAVGAGSEAAVDPELDYEWRQKIDLVIVPNPELPLERRQAVQEEWEMTGGRLRMPVRLSLSFYLMAEHNLDVAPGVLKPEKQQLVLENREDAEAARRLARQMSVQALQRAAGAR